MPQVIGVWCREEGHDVSFVCYTGLEDLLTELPSKVDLVFIGTFTESAHTAYALSNLFRSKGAITAIGGPHARCYPEDALRYFDYVLGFTDRESLHDILRDCCPHRPRGIHIAARQQPQTLPGVRERWQFIEPTLQKAPLIKIVPMIGSLGCPYQFLPYFEQETTELPRYYLDLVRKDLGLLWEWLPEGGVDHDPNAYSKSEPDSPPALGLVLGIASDGQKHHSGDRL